MARISEEKAARDQEKAADRFWSYVNIPEIGEGIEGEPGYIAPDDLCWQWKGLRTKKSGTLKLGGGSKEAWFPRTRGVYESGEAMYRIGGVRVRARDVAWQLVFGDFPEGGAPNYCQDPGCVNPNHMTAPVVRPHKEPPPVICVLPRCGRRVACKEGWCMVHMRHFIAKEIH